MKNIIIIASLLFLNVCMAQQEAQYSQYMYNTMTVNPAYAGSRGVLSFNGLYRSQWVGLEGAPKTEAFNLHMPVSYRVGAGISVVNDELGPTHETAVDAVFSYTIPTSVNGNLSFGLKAGAHLLSVDFEQLAKYQNEPSDPNSNIDRKFSPTVGAGVYYHTDRFYAGLSVPNIIETQHFENSSASIARERMHFYLIAGHVFDLDPDWKLKPAVLSKIVQGAPLQVDVSANFWYKEKVTLGASYRWSAAWSAMAAFNISDEIMLGFAYDKETTDLGNTSFNDGSFEFLLRVELFSKFGQLISPRFF